jgi:hypothetical protein
MLELVNTNDIGMRQHALISRDIAVNNGFLYVIIGAPALEPLADCVHDLGNRWEGCGF